MDKPVNASGPLPARWYVIDRDGLAALCKDEDDAQDVAAAAWVQWPRRGPYRVALLGDVAAERQRIRVLVEAVRDANAASQDEDDCLIYTPAVQRSWEALLRGLQGPNNVAQAPVEGAQRP